MNRLLPKCGRSILLQSAHGTFCSLFFFLFLTPAAQAILDVNSNGLSDLWEKGFNNGNLFPATFDPHADDDQDGWTNILEAAAGTDPKNPSPPDGLVQPVTAYHPAVEGAANSVPAVTVTWPTLTGKQYTILFSPDLTEGTWLPVGEPFIAEGGVNLYGFKELELADKRFWRVAVQDVDLDSDGLNNHEEHLAGTNPTITDSDTDTLSDLAELIAGTDPLQADADGDSWTDPQEITAGTNSRNQDTDGDGIPDPIDSQPRVSAFDFADADSDGIDDDVDAQPTTPRGPRPTVGSETAPGNPVSNLIKGETVKFIITVSNPGGPVPTASALTFFLNGIDETTALSISAIGKPVASSQRFLLTWTAKTTQGYPIRSLQNLTLRFSDAQQATSWFNLAQIDVAEWEGYIAMVPVRKETTDGNGIELEIETHINGRRHADSFGNAESNREIYYRGPRSIAVLNETSDAIVATFQVAEEVKSPLFITRFAATGISNTSTIDAGNFASYPHNCAWFFNNTASPVHYDWGGIVHEVAANSTGFQNYGTTWGDASISIDWLANPIRVLTRSTWSHEGCFRRFIDRQVHSVFPLAGYPVPGAIGPTLHSRLPASITPYLAGTVEVPGQPIHPLSIEKDGTPFLVASETFHHIVFRVDPAVENLTNGVKLRMGRTNVNGEPLPPQSGIHLYQTTEGQPLSLDASGEILLSPTVNDTLFQSLVSAQGLKLLLKRATTADQAHDLQILFVSKYEVGLETTAESVKILPIDLDVNGDGDIADACDGLPNYMPGYELDQAKLHSGSAFTSVQYSGPQAMKLIINGLATGLVDSASFKILNSTFFPGYCGNAGPEGDRQNPAKDFSFSGAGDFTEIQGTIEQDKTWAPVFCKDYGAWCEVEITLKKNGVPIGSPVRLTLPRDDNGDKLADVWQDQQNTAWNDQFNPSPARPTTSAGRSLVSPDLDDESIDPDGSNGDGGRDLPAMSAAGDGLKISQEYRGFILDGGPGAVAGRHKRLSAARKELLVECSVENDLTSANKNGAGTNQAVLAGFTVAGAMVDVSNFYRDAQEGASIDLYWVVDEIEQPGEWVSYAPHPFLGRGAWERYGDVKYYHAPDMVWAAGVPLRDDLWRFINQSDHDRLYVSGLPKLKSINRNPDLGAFVKLLLPTRTGYLKGGLGTDGNGQTAVDPDVLQYFSDGAAGEHSHGTTDGAYVCIAAMVDEGIGIYRSILNRHFTANEFAGLSRRVIAHELGHLIHDNHSGTAHGDTIMDDTSMVMPDGTVRSITTSQWHPNEIESINLPARQSIDPSP